jgi:hypothetical protein
VTASGAGRLLAAATRAVAAVRPADKPLHPDGRTSGAVLERHGSSAPDRATAAPWLLEPGRDRAVVRTSRAVGLPHPLPDIHGLAIRVHRDDQVVDILLATTGRGSVGRYLLRPVRRADEAFYGSLLPYRSPGGPVSLGALAAGDDSWELFWTAGRGSWVPFARLRREVAPHDADISFDPVLHVVPGLTQYDALARLRSPAYRSARRSRTPAGTSPT